MRKNVAGQKIGAQLVSATDGSAFTGSVTVYVTGDAGTQAAGSVGSGACTHEGNGYHTYAPAQAETNYDLIAFTFTGTGAVPATVQVYTLPTTGVLAPTVADRTLDVSATGEAGIDWANVGSPTTTLNLSGTTVKTATDVETDTADIQSRLPAALVSGKIDANISHIGGAALSTSTAQLGVNVVNLGGSATPVTNMNTVFNTDFAANYNTTADKWKVDVTHSAGVQVYASDFTVASATASTVTLPTTDSAGTAIPDDDRYVYCVLRVVAGTGIGQVVLLTTAAASARQYNILSGTCPVQLDNTSECVVEGAWQSNLAHINGAAVSTSTAQLGVNVVNFGGSAGTFSSGRPEVNASHLGGSTTPITNMTTVFSTDFAANYNTTDDKWVVKLGDGTVHGGTTAVGQFNLFTVGGDNLATMDGSGRVSANVTAISDDATAAANLEAYTDGTTYMPVDAHKQNWTAVDADTISVKGPDGTTEAYTKTVTTSGTADPITGSTLD